VPKLNFAQPRRRGDEPVGWVSMLPSPQGCLAGDGFGNGQDFKAFQGQVQPGDGVWTRQFTRAPFAHNFHAGDRAQITLIGTVVQGGFNPPRQRQTPHETKPDSGIGQDPHAQISRRTGSSILTPWYAAGSSGVSTRHGLPRPGMGINWAAGWPCRRMTTVSPDSTRSTNSHNCFFTLAMGACMTINMTTFAGKSTQKGVEKQGARLGFPRGCSLASFLPPTLPPHFVALPARFSAERANTANAVLALTPPAMLNLLHINATQCAGPDAQAPMRNGLDSMTPGFRPLPRRQRATCPQSLSLCSLRSLRSLRSVRAQIPSHHEP